MKAVNKLVKAFKKKPGDSKGPTAENFNLHDYVKKDGGEYKLDRKDFLKLSGQGVMVSLLPSFTADCGVQLAEGEKSKKAQYLFVVDTTTCIGCGKCMEACRTENNVPEGQYRTWVENYTITAKDGKEKVHIENVPETGLGLEKRKFKDPVIKSFNVPKLCNHCENSPCTQVCPTNASYTTPEGVVLVDKDTCVGCGYCVQACPYGTRYMDEITGVVDKCTLCYHRISKDENPACVDICPSSARLFGNVLDEDDDIQDILKDERLNVLKPEMGTEPMTQYIGLNKSVV